MTWILDTNLLLLFIVGSTDPQYISKHKRLTSYNQNDFSILVQILFAANEIIVTPNTLSETSNLAAYISEPARSHIFHVFRHIIASAAFTEYFVESQVAADRPEFLRLGLTDAALLEIGTQPRVLLTADLDLYLAAHKNGLRAENFNYLRGM